ncbi:MAG: hypothetical protein FJX47_17320, partial [Alphaproteobacteria bacterium]|nr:hypothetical protein [Alphaproteobacteria bacterium]
MSTRDPGRGRLIAVLGPTNTGKTHLAVERMLGHRSGMMGLPLRLLAREIYDRVAARIGKSEVALVTGEEKIQPRNARYFICTVEAMPLDRSVAFLCVDEIQLCGDPERGHVFTDRLLWARGGEETMFLGAETAKAVIRRLVPGIAAETRPRFSTLTYSGPRKLSRLKPRSAVVAFSAASVYAIAELLRRQRGGTALVMGALSPRTRNAQVALFQSGEVDYLVATDAIGMGLNMDVDHVAFAELVKFDGHAPRQLSAAEIGQIAGRAGRHMASGSFGTTAEAPDLDPDTIDRVENHRFETLKALYWRNPDLDFTSLPALIGSLGAPPPHDALRRAREADDEGALKMLATDREIADLARAPARLRLLWDVCRVPDFRKTSLESHVRLLGRLYRFLTAADERIPTDWIARQIAHLDRLDGDIDTLLARIAHVRTWTYVTHRGDWLADAEAWQERTRALEDRLSDALHDRLTQRFVDRHTAHLLRRLRDQRHLAAEVAPEGEVSLDGAPVGRLEGFRFLADAQPAGSELGRRAQRQAVLRGLAPVLAEKVVALVESGADDFTLAPDATIAWRGARVAQLVAGPKVLAPRIDVLGQENLDTRQSEALRHRLATWLTAELRKRLAPLYRLIDADAD